MRVPLYGGGKMASAVIQLQSDVLDQRVTTSDLLRRAFVIARKLSLGEFEAWINHELNGYGPTDVVPEYRIVHGDVRGWNPFRGWIPVIFEGADEADAASRRGIGQSIAELEQLLSGFQPGGQLHIPFTHQIQRSLSASVGFETTFFLFVSHTAIIRILDAVRNTILNWALRLEADGIRGEGLTFSRDEKRVANSASYNVNNFFGPVGQADIQQACGDVMRVSVELDLDQVRSAVEQIRNILPQLQLDPATRSEAEADLVTINAQLASPKPKKGVIREAVSSLKSILEGAGGNIVGQLILELAKALAGG